MVKDEYDGIQSVLKSKNYIQKLYSLIRYKILKPIFLLRWDKFIAERIAETLRQDETGILFIGAFHEIIKKLPRDITVLQLKEIAKIRKYQKIIQADYRDNTAHFERLTEYLISKL
ncbi:hypothetical protein [Labilibaculum euxinus]|uniref:Uncharacterized protein n=1 Tax=Labilibaculum euxinus TaxID=2686357 RepID=A0A7M4D540_9BACT|nr:hypothetical protein [Labilibaculum euxinus]MUP37769.1 hypothetical protein [Labilibaculum euxinus]MVB06974.1 hypothetical protein [Labilibaculum euxinus]